MRKMIAFSAVLAAGTLMGLGCTSSVIAPEGTTAATYRLGKLKDTLTTDIGTAYKVSMQATQELGLRIIQSGQDQLQGKIVARTAEDKRVVISLPSITEKATQITIDTGSLASASRVYRAVMQGLGEPTPTQSM